MEKYFKTESCSPEVIGFVHKKLCEPEFQAMEFGEHLKYIKKNYPYVEALASIAFPEFDLKNLSDNDPRMKFFSIKKEIGSSS